jgi:hypothetical protein
MFGRAARLTPTTRLMDSGPGQTYDYKYGVLLATTSTISSIIVRSNFGC